MDLELTPSFDSDCGQTMLKVYKVMSARVQDAHHALDISFVTFV